MQNMEGQPAGNCVASELVAMFSLAVLPKIRSYYYDPANPEAFKAKCQAYAAERDLPPHMWPLITLPASLSFDWDSKHDQLRKAMSLPRAPAGEVDTHLREALQQLVAHADTPGTLRPASQGAQDLRFRTGAGLNDAERLEWERVQAAQAALSKYQADNGCDYYLYTLWERSLWQPDYITVIPQAMMPLSKVSPDVHCTPEHMIGTTKTDIREQLMDRDLNDPQLWRGRTYQLMILDAVQRRGNGDAGLYHIRHSIQKWPKILQILAAEAGEVLELEHVFGKPGKRKKTKHIVHGTAGGWIRDSKWT